MRFYKAPWLRSKLWATATALCLLGLSPTWLGAQNEQKTKVGALVGIGTSQISNSVFNGFHRSGLVAGGFFSQKLSANSAWQVELSYQQKGARDSNNITGIRVNELSIPVIYRYFIGPIAFEGGLGLDLHLNASFSDNTGSQDFSDAFRSAGFSVLFGVNYHLQEKIWVSFRVQNSVLPIQAGSVPSGIGPALQIGGGGWRHTVLTAALYYSFW